MTELALALAAFLGTHFLMSHPLRAPLVGAIGATGFQILYSLVALATFGWAILAFRAAPATQPLWIAPEWLWTVASIVMLLGSILLAGSFFGNPALPAPGAQALAARPPRGVFAITRHPMMWSFALWSLVHAAVAPNQATLLLTAAIAFLALAGSAGQDFKKGKLMGEAWGEWAARTSFVPLGNQIAGRASWASAWPGRTVFLLGVIIWLIASWLHPQFGLPLVGPWRWA
jgi:uncharacterized membrane protein